ncbi:RDD family protein [Microcoleus sp. FACHB-672]|uniref:RDD family protein n=1 Tax=Microcoleus sp. FACHB-672 TaxID=2692825 RepID=UPI001688F8CF|nr:RDD family protein [Microcoleus sp. FACHB-672]MBD2043047.1 RDD family protein [Microcoleus sp. FACHB-672]
MRFFNRVTLQTPESVELEFTLAGIGNRSLALLIDYLIWGLILFLVLIVWYFFATQLVDLLDTLININDLQLWLISIWILITFFIYVGYFVFFETLWQGQTPGKRFAGIRVIRDDGRTVGLQQATLRALLRPVDDTLFIGAVLIMLTRREKRLGDMAAGTVVIQADRAVAPARFPISEPAQQLAEQLPYLANLPALLPDDFAVIREYLQRRSAMEPKAKSELSRQLASQVKNVIALEELREKVSADVFLEAVYLAYQSNRT